MKNMFVAFLLNLCFSIFEFVGGYFTNSVAIMSDAIHDLGDAISIGISCFCEYKSKKPADQRYTYGYLRYSVLGAAITSTILFCGSVWVIGRSVYRILYPEPIHYDGMLIFAVFGVVVNTLAALITRDGNSLNQKAVNLHMLEDVLGWIIVLVGAIIMKFTNITLIDPIMSVGVSVFILINATLALKEIKDIFLETSPETVDMEDILQHINEMPAVKQAHHFHIWSIDENTLCCTIHIKTEEYSTTVKQEIQKILKEHGITHSTIEFELNDEKCVPELLPAHRCSCGHRHHHHRHRH